MVTVSDQAKPASKDQVKAGYSVYGPGSPVFFAISAIYNLLWTRFTVLQPPDTWHGQVQCYLLYLWLLAAPQTVLNAARQ
jgi:hypothetical protein